MPHCVLVVHLDAGLEVLHEQADVLDGRMGAVGQLHLDDLLLPLPRELDAGNLQADLLPLRPEQVLAVLAVQLQQLLESPDSLLDLELHK